MAEGRPDSEDKPGADRPEDHGQGADIIPFRPRPQPPAPRSGTAGRGPVIGPRSRIAGRLRLGEAATFGALFALVALLVEEPVRALPFLLLGFGIAAFSWFTIAPRRGPIDNGTVFVAALASALAGWLAYALVKSIGAGGGALTVFEMFVGGIAYAMVVAWPVGIAAGFVVRRLALQWRPAGRG
ncbi:hypothetical protein [Zavarzinia compransoris]|uniref:Uncharacterized protein n=1 Tax=Zavarzinia compransoris TaxID=1264899 RepID=A0A317E2K1_9PROT|nr:hypothetical protein [Zavarzinia compransoris]PWR20831.1 hypothetical protein DKG75_12630 [Zavarzinia compransoris]TDP44333.1 hypothetical protein DES42_10798 [Zavarzinia compransoris]